MATTLATPFSPPSTPPATQSTQSSPYSTPRTPENQIIGYAETPPTSPTTVSSRGVNSKFPVNKQHKDALRRNPAIQGAHSDEQGVLQHAPWIETPVRVWTGCLEPHAESTSHQGEWSVVYKASLQFLHPNEDSSMKVFAIKEFQPSLRHLAVLRHEAQILSHLMAKPFASNVVVGFHGLYAERNALVMDYLDIDLEKAARDDPHPSSQRLWSWAFDLIVGLEFLHSQQVVHGDIKPSNILLKPNVAGRIKHCRMPSWAAGTQGLGLEQLSAVDWYPVYCDFGSSRLWDGAPTDSAATFDFMAPELFNTTSNDAGWPTKPSDVFALGLTLVFIATGTYPYSIGSTSNNSRKIALAKLAKPLECVKSDADARIRLQRSGLEVVIHRSVRPELCERTTASKWRLTMEEFCCGDSVM